MEVKNKKIKVLFRLRSMEMGGVQKVMLDLLKHLPRDKFDLTLLLNLYQGELRTEIPSQIKLIYLAKGKEDFSKNPIINKSQKAFRRLKLYIFDTFPKLLYWIKTKENYDIEIAASYSEFDMVLNSYNKKSRKIAWFHTDVSYDKNKDRVKERIEKMKKFDHVVFCAFHIRDVIEKQYQIVYPDSSVVYNAIHPEVIKAKASEFEVSYENFVKPIFCSVGRLHSRKGYHTLIKIHSRLIQEGFQHTIVVLGDGEEKENLKEQIQQENVNGTFKLLGTKINPYPYIKNADCFVLPTQSEAYPLVINEALILEKPIISTNVGGIPEMIDNGQDGILVNYDENEIYKAMKQFFIQPELVEELKQNTKNSVKKLDSQKIYDQVTDLFIKQYNKIGK